jgi:4-hydroxy 2-oxovalerate aldolase
MSTPAPIRITDTTLRDGSHAMAHQFTEEQVRATVHALDAAGVEVIEVSHGDGLGGSSFNYGFSRVDEIALIAAGVEEATQAKIAVLLVPGIGTKDDLRNAREAGASVARIATHCTEADVSIQHFGLARDLGMETVGFLMMAHKTTPAEMARQARIMVDAGAECVYCVDSAGALVLGDAQERVQAMYAEIGHQAEIGFHGHQNLSLGVANSVLAAAEEVVRPFLPRWPKMDRSAIVQGWAGGVQQLPAARRAGRGALRRRRARDPAAGRRAWLRRRPGRHDHRHRRPARPGPRPGRHRCPLNVIPHIFDGQETESASAAPTAPPLSCHGWRSPWDIVITCRPPVRIAGVGC